MDVEAGAPVFSTFSLFRNCIAFVLGATMLLRCTAFENIFQGTVHLYILIFLTGPWADFEGG